MSPIDCGWNTCANQWVLTPCIGKTRPPLGPWNDSTMMVMRRAVEEQHEQPRTAATGGRRCGDGPRAASAQSSSPHVDDLAQGHDHQDHGEQEDHGVGGGRRELQVAELGRDRLADRGHLAAAQHVHGDEVAHDDGDDEDRADDDAGLHQRQDDVADGLPLGSAGIGRGLDQRLVDADHRVEDRHDHEQRVEVDEAQDHREVGVEQPFLRLVDDAQRQQRGVDHAVAAEQRDPRDHADDVAGPERDRADQEQRHLPAQRARRRTPGSRRSRSPARA